MKKVLLISGLPYVFSTLKYIINSNDENIKVDCAYTTEEGIDLLKKDDYTLIILSEEMDAEYRSVLILDWIQKNKVPTKVLVDAQEDGYDFTPDRIRFHNLMKSLNIETLPNCENMELVVKKLQNSIY